ncbi:GNAT family N-acetyltransferase [Ensifer sp. PDNC004]|uniref:GNAT family N-acetyltransferase n=1 Tax=Ensifer sp. PDNC004 TaxID=2811423 RepID=UPI0019654BCD|nr:GNAT family protein [Ensifer sp. PDNC004]QRY69172.1 GNAT family N-acetyltransferase [Ensifer sp. PDNC004]
MTLVWGGERAPEINAAVASFVAGGIPGCERGWENFTTLGLVDGDRLVAGVVFHNYNPEAGVIELSAAATSRRWLTRPMLKAMFRYPFDQVGCQMVVLRVSERNTVMVGIAERFGFTAHRIPRLRGREEAEILFTFTDDDWRAHPVNRR